MSKLIQFLPQTGGWRKKDQLSCPICHGVVIKLFDTTLLVINGGITHDYVPTYYCVSCHRLFKEEDKDV